MRLLVILFFVLLVATHADAVASYIEAIYREDASCGGFSTSSASIGAVPNRWNRYVLPRCRRFNFTSQYEEVAGDGTFLRFTQFNSPDCTGPRGTSSQHATPVCIPETDKSEEELPVEKEEAIEYFFYFIQLDPDFRYPGEWVTVERTRNCSNSPVQEHFPRCWNTGADGPVLTSCTNNAPPALSADVSIRFCTEAQVPLPDWFDRCNQQCETDVPSTVLSTSTQGCVPSPPLSFFFPPDGCYTRQPCVKGVEWGPTCSCSADGRKCQAPVAAFDAETNLVLPSADFTVVGNVTVRPQASLILSISDGDRLKVQGHVKVNGKLVLTNFSDVGRHLVVQLEPTGATNPTVTVAEVEYELQAVQDLYPDCEVTGALETAPEGLYVVVSAVGCPLQWYVWLGVGLGAAVAGVLVAIGIVLLIRYQRAQQTKMANQRILANQTTDYQLHDY